MTRAASAIPGLRDALGYDRAWLGADLLAGATVWALLVPQGLAYAGLAGVDPVVGLYAAIGAMLGYLAFGSARYLNVGPEATIALVSASAVGPIAAADPELFLSLTVTLTLIVGIALIIFWALRLGWLSRLLSRPLLTGYLTGTAVTMVIGQMDDLLGISLTTKDDPIGEALEILTSLGETHLPTLIVGLAVIGSVLVMRRVDKRIPAYLVAVAGSIALSILLGFDTRGIAVVGDVPGGLPRPALPELHLAYMNVLLPAALAMAILAFADSGVTAQLLARSSRSTVDSDQEFLGLGAANIGSSLLGGIAVNGSASRSFTAVSSGAKSRFHALVVVALVILTLLFLMPLVAPLPKAALAAIITLVAVSLVDVAEIRLLWRLDRNEFRLAALTAVAVLVVGVIVGIAVVVVISLLLVVLRAGRPQAAELVQVPGTDSYRTKEAAPDGSTVKGMVLWRFDGPLFFANVAVFHTGIAQAIEAAEPHPTVVLIDFEAIYDLDSTAIRSLLELIDELRASGIRIWLARVKSDVRDYLERGGVLAELGPDSIYLEVSDAVDAFRAAGGARRSD